MPGHQIQMCISDEGDMLSPRTVLLYYLQWLEFHLHKLHYIMVMHCHKHMLGVKQIQPLLPTHKEEQLSSMHIQHHV